MKNLNILMAALTLWKPNWRPGEVENKSFQGSSAGEGRRVLGVCILTKAELGTLWKTGVNS